MELSLSFEGNQLELRSAAETGADVFLKEQVIGFLNEYEAQFESADPCCARGVSDTRDCTQKARFGGLHVAATNGRSAEDAGSHC